ncbi:META domain-containing protein [Photobacterium aquimaris]|uniref:Heat shock protein HslJ n=1 Tax=Photobacterium aquimaris TaxID=512643 RepID=A0A1B8I102_9GAMM|nr:META domain-containing protein [Photobacterium aquimaris]MCP4954866.1 META domain-containing protein [Photobacterium aquimaris]OBU22920.1 heat-shock protein HslJ [Photobacterium aquimaris]PQJ41413.1 heat-shock protein HslJ [Photobacterium aquimaris]PSU01081.1 META domain-containing protein [Photobacterium aquimaris]SMY16702.1 Heat shock protein HslJ [Photobacterium aquimaris]
MKKRLLSALVLPMMLAACSTTGINTPTTPHQVTGSELANGSWSLVKIDNQDIAQPAPFQSPTLELATDLAANGHAGCNRYFGQAEVKDGQFRIEKMGMTMMLCPDNEMKIEQTFAQSLADWNKVSISGDTMTMTNAKHTLTFTRDAAATNAQ